MSRTSPVHYIAPSAISITPNANGSVNDLAVYVARSAKIRVYSPRAGIGYDGNAEYKQWTLTGRNRRLTASQTPYTIYARISKTDIDDGYVVFAQKVQEGDVWKDKYPYVTTDGLASGTAGRNTGNYWYIRIGDVSIPSEGARTVTLDTGILGTDQYNTDWSVSPDALPLRVEVSCVVDDEDVGQNAYVYWDQVLVMTASLVEGWTGTDAQRFRHWSITRNTGNSDADAAWLLKDYVRAFKTTGSIRLSHIRGSFDDFGGAVSTLFTVTAWGVPEGQDDADESEYVVLAELPVSILAETAAKYNLVLTPNIIGYNPMTDEYSPAGGCVVSIRATDQRSDVFNVTFAQFRGAQLAGSYAEVGSSTWVPLTFSGSDDMPAQAVIPVSAFAAQKSLNVRLVNAAAKELDSDTVAFVRDGEDSRDREWIFLRSQEPITFGDASSEHPAPSYIQSGEVNPSGAAGAVTEDKNQEGWVPEGWWDEQQGTDADNPYEYGSYRDYVRATDEEDGHWGDFSMPRIWTHYGEDGILYSILTDADSVSIPTDQASVTTGFNAVFQRKAGDNTPAAYQCYYAAYRRHGNTYSRFEHSGLTRVSSVVFGNIAVSSDSASQNYCEAIVIYISDSPLSAGALQSAPPDSYLAKKEISVIKDGNTGPSGEDAYGVYVNPGYAIFEETLNSGIPVVDTSGWVGVIQVLKGSAPQPFKLTYGQHSHCRPTSDSTQEDTSVLEATVKFDLLKTQGAYSSEGYLAISVTTDDGAYTNTNVKIPYYLSLLDTLKKAAANWFLSKEYDDTAKGNINFEQDVAVGGDFSVAGDATIDGILMALEQIFTNRIQSDNFNGDGPFDTGFELTKSDGNGYSYLVVDKLFVRLKAIFNELEIRKISYSGGNFIFSHAGSHIVYVKELQQGVESEVEGTVLKLSGDVDVADNVLNVGSGSVSDTTLTLSSDKRVYAYRCYIMKDDGTTATENWWRVDDQARCQTFNVVEPGHYENISNTIYWRRVIAVGHEKVRLNDSEQEQEYDYVDLSLIDCMQGSDIPKAGDQIVQMGNRTDAERQGFISLEVAGEYAPAFKVYKGVNYYTLDGKRKICISPKLTDIRAQKFIIETEYDARQMPMERGDWSRIPEHKCYYYNLVQHNGATWLCVCPEGEYTTEEPSETATYWRPYAQKGKDGADSITTSLSTQTVEIPTDTDGVCLEDTQVELSARLFVGSKEVKVTDIVVDEQSSQRVTSVVKSTLDMMPWAASADASVQGNVITFSRNASVHGNVLTIGGDAFNVTPSKVVVTIAKGTVVDEHTVNLRVTGVDEDKTTHYGFAAFNVQRHYIPVDGQNIIVTPAALIVNQSLQNPDNLSQLSEEIIFSATMGERQVAVNKVEVTSTEHCTVEGSNGNKATVRAIGTYTEEGSHYYYDKANFICKVYTAYGVIENVKADIYANLLGTWKETVEADTKTAIAQSTLYEFTGDAEVSHTEKLGEFIASSKKYETKLTQKVIDANGNVIESEGSVYKQTYDAIKIAVGNTGIDIINNKITAKTSNFEIVNSSGTKTFGIDSSGNLESSGSASFKGKITAISGTIGGFSIGEHKINSSNNKIVLNDDGTATIGNMSVASDGKITATGVDISGKITASDGAISGDIQVTGSLYAGPSNGRHVRIMPDGTANGGIKLYNGSNVLASFSFGQESEGSIPVWLPMIKVFKPNDSSFSRITADGLLASVDSNYSTRASYGPYGFNIMSSDLLVDFGISNGKLYLSAYNHASLQHAWETNPDNISYGGVYLAYIGGRSVLCVKT